MDTILIKATQLLLALAILVIIHELGHFLFARMFGVRVNKFYMFYNPWTTLVKWRPGKYFGTMGRKKHYDPEIEREHLELCKLEKQAEEESNEILKEADPLREELGALKRRIFLSIFTPGNNERDKERIKYLEGKIEDIKDRAAEVQSEAYSIRAAFEEKYYYSSNSKRKRNFWKQTEYGIGWLPLGGYCMIAGMIDESMDKEQMKLPPKKWEFRSRPAWQRLLIMVAGVLFNFLLAVLIYAAIVYATGEKYVPFTEAKMGMAWTGEAQKIGFRDGDIPLMADGKTLDKPNEARMQIAQASNVTVLRGKDTVNIKIPEKFLFNLDAESKSDTTLFNMMTYRIPTQVIQVAPGFPADKADMKAGDLIIAVDSVQTPTIFDFKRQIANRPSDKVALTIVRNIDTRKDTLVKNITLSESSTLGVGLEIDPSKFYKSEEIKYNIFQSVPRGMEMGKDRLVSYAKSMGLVFTKEGAASVGGFGTLGSIFPEKWDWIAFWNIAAFLSVALAFMNILPIPALDGGHVLFLLYEVIFRRKPSDKFMEWAQITGMLLLILLLVYANGMDIVRLFK